MDGLVAFVILAAFVFGLAIAYKKRFAISKWLEDPDIALSSDPITQRRRLTRRIEDYQRRVELLDEIESKKNKSQ